MSRPQCICRAHWKLCATHSHCAIAVEWILRQRGEKLHNMREAWINKWLIFRQTIFGAHMQKAWLICSATCMCCTYTSIHTWPNNSVKENTIEIAWYTSAVVLLLCCVHLTINFNSTNRPTNRPTDDTTWLVHLYVYLTIILLLLRIRNDICECDDMSSINIFCIHYYILLLPILNEINTM